jgi:hypothetical protein
VVGKGLADVAGRADQFTYKVIRSSTGEKPSNARQGEKGGKKGHDG